VNFQASMQQPGVLQQAEADSTSIGRRRFTEYMSISVGPAVLQTVFDPKAAMAGFGLLRLQSPRDALLVRWEQQFRVCSTDRPNRAH
jgi:hypothetical protein